MSIAKFDTTQHDIYTYDAYFICPWRWLDNKIEDDLRDIIVLLMGDIMSVLTILHRTNNTRESNSKTHQRCWESLRRKCIEQREWKI